jgi:integrase/DNA-binding transcriptional regulator YiaG
MASYLWIRGRRAFFQIRPPSDLKPELGSTPFRIRLPAQTHREASRYARHLAGLAERWFSAMRYRGVRRLGLGAALAGDESWTESDFAEARVNVRKGFVNSLMAEVQELNRVAEQWETLSKFKVADADEQQHVEKKQKEIFERVTSGWNVFAKKFIEDYDQIFEDMLNSRHRSDTVDLAQKLRELNENYCDDSREWKEEIGQIKAVNQELETAKQHADAANTAALSQILFEGPLLSECLEEFIAAKTLQLPDSKEPVSFRHRLNAFLLFIGDKPISAYTISDLGLFADRLRHLPKRHSVDPAWQGKSLKEALEENERRSPDKRAVTLSRTTVRANYIGKVKTAFRWMCSQHKVKYPFAYDHVLLPAGLPPPAERFSLDAVQLNALFTVCASETDKKRPEDVWLPLLAYLTGARLGELVGLRLSDIIRFNDEDVVDLSTRVTDEGGVLQNRQIKNDESRRRFVLHRKLRELGFLDWVDEQRLAGHSFLFPDLHRAVRPTHAASKRFQRLFKKKLKMDPEYVFHSLRHTFKDWTRDEEVDERTIAIQAGHALDGIALNYGSKRLRPKEMTKIASLDLQKGVNLDVFKGIPFPKSAPPERKRPLNERIVRFQRDDAERSSELAIATTIPARPATKSQSEDRFDIKKLRANLGMSQKVFADTFGFTCGAVRDWEQGRTSPGRSARIRLYAIAQDPDRLVLRSNWPD